MDKFNNYGVRKNAGIRRMSASCNSVGISAGGSGGDDLR